MRALYALLMLLCAGAPAAADATPGHLLAGVRAFKEGRYEEALVELRVVARSPGAPADLAFYLGPTLYKLGRHREAIAVFVASRAPRDQLSDFYLGQAYYQARLYRKARGVFARLRSRGLGPALDAAAARYVGAIDAAYRSPPPPAAIDAYVAQAAEVAAADPVLAGELLDEARLVEALAPARHRRAEILATLGAALLAAGRPQVAIEVLAAEPALSGAGRWQLARAHAAAGDPARARPLLQALADDKKEPRAADAAALLATLPP